MPVELRKRKAPPQPAPAPAPKKASTGSGIRGKVAKAKEAVKEAVSKATGKGAEKTSVAVGSTIDLAAFGGEIETNDGQKTTLGKLVEESKGGVVLFTYPKASTPGCTQQACLFRDSYTPLTATGLSIYGLSTDSPKANTTFRDKQKLPYPLLCDPASALIGAIGFAKKPRGTQRGVFVVDKQGKVLAAEPGGPAATVDVVRRLVDGMDGVETTDGAVAEPAAAAAAPAAEAPAAEAPAVEEAPAKKEEEPAPAVEAPAPTAASEEAATAAVAAAPVPAPVPVVLPEAPPAAEPKTEALAIVPSKEDKEKAEVAAEVADTAAKVDGEDAAKAS